MWKSIESFSNYEASNDGFIRNKYSKQILYPRHNNQIKLNDDNKKRKEVTISNIIAKTFIENPNDYKYTIHKDGNHLNNSVENIEWSSKRDTSQKIYKLDLDCNFVDVYETIYVLLNDLSEEYSKYLEMSKEIYNAIESGETYHGYKWCFEKESYILSEELVGKNNYKVTKDGLILHNGVGKPMIKIKINDKKYKVGYLIASTFMENPYNCEKVKHKDGDELNNDISNLEWDMKTKTVLNHEEEIWRSIPKDADYECSNKGNIRHKIKKENLAYQNHSTGYLKMRIKSSNYTVHRLVAQLFIPNPENKLEVDHINKVRDDNDINNLRWMTRTEQMTNTKDRKKKGWPEMKIKRIDMITDETIEEYNSQYDATQWIIDNDISKSQFKEITKRIMVVCRGERPNMYGYKWKFSENNELNDEEWKEIDPEIIDGTMGYKASNMGRIKDPNGNIHEGYIREGEAENNYRYITIKHKSYILHRMIAKVFIDNPDNKKVVNHKNGDKTDCKVNNLEWVSHLENCLHSSMNYKNRNTKIKGIDKDGNETEYFSIREAERQLDISQLNIRRCLKKEREEIKGYKFVYV